MDARAAVAEAGEGLTQLGHKVRYDVPLLRPNGLARTDVVGFGSPYPSQRSACFAAQFCPSPSDAVYYACAVAPVGVRYVYLPHADWAGHIWRLDLDMRALDRVAPVKITEAPIPVSQIRQHLVERADEFGPQPIIREKFGQLTAHGAAAPWQPSFVAAGLLDLQEEQTADSLVKLLNESAKAALHQWKGLGGCPDDAHLKVGKAFLRLIAARALVDKGFAAADPTDRQASIRAAHELLLHFMAPRVMSSVPDAVQQALWERIQEARFQLLTGDVLAGVYERGLITPEEKKEHGVHYTPACLRRFLWRAVSEHIGSFAPQDRIILDPTCGSGAFLLTAFEGLALQEESDLFGDQPDVFRDRLLGVDRDPFACDIARLGLILQSEPVRNSWLIANTDFQNWQPNQARRPRLVIGNPPFSGGLASKVLLRALDWLAPGGVVALVMPLSYLTNPGEKEARQELEQRAVIESVVEIPDKVFRHSQASVCAIVARRPAANTPRPGAVFSFRSLNHASTPAEQKRDFQMGEDAFAQHSTQIPSADFAEGAFGLNDLWRSLRNTQPAKDVVELHRGIDLRGKKGDVTANVADQPLPGYLPYLRNAAEHIQPFRITSTKYLQWAPSLLYRPGQPEWWLPDKVVLGQIVTHKQRWRLIGAIDRLGVAYASRIIGCFPKTEIWAPTSLLCLYSSSYANAWYSAHNRDPHVVLAILDELPVPILSEDRHEHLMALGTALEACADAAADPAPRLDAATHAYLMRRLLHQVDRVICDGLGIGREQEEEINRFLIQAGKERPGLPAMPEGREPFCLGEWSPEEAGRLLRTTGLVLAVDPERERGVVWLDSLDLRVPVCLPLEWLPPEARFGGKAIAARANIAATSVEQVTVRDIAACPEAHLPRETLVARLEALLSDSAC